MNRLWLAFVGIALAVPASSQTLTRQNLAGILGFENGVPGQFPAVWGGGPTDTIFIDGQVKHSGNYSARLERTAASAQAFSTVTAHIPLDFPGSTIQWRGYFKTENVNGYAALWLREDSDTASGLAFDTLQGLNLNGTRDWAQYTVTVPVLPAGTQLYFGFLLTGAGKAWVDDLELLVDGVPVGQIVSPLTTDHEFDAASRVTFSSLSSLQIQNLATLAKVWGFLKYHHPAVAGGLHHWDYDLFRVLPQVLAAPDNAAALTALSEWITNLGPVAACTVCATLDRSNLALPANVDWISDTSLLGPALSATLQSIYANRRTAPRQFYLSLAPGANNPSFDNELSYPTFRLPDAGYRLLALFRFWNMVRYFYPNREIMADYPAGAPDYWNGVLEEFIPAVGLASDSVSYPQQMMRFIAKINDTHANLWSSLAVRPPIGNCLLPVDVRFVEGKALVLRLTSKTAGAATVLQAGDIIEQLDGVPVADLVAQWAPIYADSNQAARLRDMGWSLTQGSCGSAPVVVERGGQHLSLVAARVLPSTMDFSYTYTHDLPGDTFRMLSNEVAYLKLSSVQAAQSANYIRSAAGTKGLIIDLRNYPSEFVVFTLGQLLVSQPRNFAQFTNADPVNPGAFRWGTVVQLIPAQPHYSGRVVILVDEITQSQAEYTTMAFRTAPGAIVMGSTTAGADGNVSTVPLPGGLSSYISGLGVFFPNGRPTQRVGILPDIRVTPTVAGIRAGRDELIEAAIAVIESGRPPHQIPRK